jgi:conjugal transfer pilus assembly protein TrbC
MPSAAELARQPAPVLPRIDALPLQRGIDAGALAAQYEAIRQPPNPAGERPTSGLLVFVTLQMPRVSLQRLVEQAERARATLVLRGLMNRSMKATLAEVAELIGKRKVAWIIDPESFRRYGVALAPTFVLVAPQGGFAAGCGSGQCVADPAYSSVAGDVSTAYALQLIEQGDPAFKPQALAYRRRLEARP